MRADEPREPSLWLLPLMGSGVTILACVTMVTGYYFFVFRPRMQKLTEKYEQKAGKEAAPGIDTRSYSLKTKKALGVAPNAVPVKKGGRVRVVYATVKGTCKAFAEQAVHVLRENGFAADVEKLGECGREHLLSAEAPILFVLPTYEGGKPPASCANFMVWLNARVEDSVKFSPKPKYAILGMGHSAYASAGNYNQAAKDLHRALKRGGARPFGPGVVLGDEGKGTQDAAFREWIDEVLEGLKNVEEMAHVGVYEVGTEADVTNEADDDAVSDDASDEVPDLEDLGGSSKIDPNAEMVNPRMRTALTKQGYKLLGSHSGVKLCRWTKAQLRGRGGCYKHTFYGITSYQCMEMTPSLACANKCVFCWRHHTNPVAKEWKWKTDAPDFLVDEAVKGQREMIKPLKGVPGVLKERYEDALNPIHCALSLVGEPIIYPEINGLCDHLHERGISSFLVTNAQFPEKIEELRPVTQLYISVDAATKDSMKKIDRPIFDDFWERFLHGVDAMRAKGQRTVFRLTLVKDWNATEVGDYAQIIQRGNPDFVEVKGVTFCGESTASNLSMGNVPFHSEVVKFCTQLAEACGEQYGLASEHEHSCCILIANKKFFREGQWHTWIDFKKFHELINAGKPFATDDYLLPTPDWGNWGSPHKGFDPDETRYIKVRNHPGKTATPKKPVPLPKDEDDE
eukprot:TRINITY_DN1431_c0_g1_i1.p1 TRINITY_DN1431_c0_g1~~TRINITY_DN1431_c0_g1_i1.p1  ORF type:complete len:683 (+),score=283.98 TRINITY_DN1431_c0_g1_i1:68-2116(+)